MCRFDWMLPANELYKLKPSTNATQIICKGLSWVSFVAVHSPSSQLYRKPAYKWRINAERVTNTSLVSAFQVLYCVYMQQLQYECNVTRVSMFANKLCRKVDLVLLTSTTTINTYPVQLHLLIALQYLTVVPNHTLGDSRLQLDSESTSVSSISADLLAHVIVTSCVANTVILSISRTRKMCQYVQLIR